MWTTPGCRAYYGVLRNDSNPEALSSTSFTMTEDSTVQLAIGHQHVGSINISITVNGKLLCASYPTYGTQEGVPGNEKGFLVKMSHCISPAGADPSTVNAGPLTVEGPIQLSAGDEVTLKSYYWVGSEDKRTAPIPGGTHLNVMGYMYTAYTSDAAEGAMVSSLNDDVGSDD